MAVVSRACQRKRFITLVSCNQTRVIKIQRSRLTRILDKLNNLMGLGVRISRQTVHIGRCVERWEPEEVAEENSVGGVAVRNLDQEVEEEEDGEAQEAEVVKVVE
mmetsp:Transcript_23896/g.32859  ORF Transcript_23896/g.32859 Transcript_23896/m.32859 type:complete len:105 (+) Transcript_23896:742-1056(+)